MMQRLRREIRDSLAPYSDLCMRPPVLRRFRGQDALLSTDAGTLLSPEAYGAWQVHLRETGWYVSESNGWTHVDPPWAAKAKQAGMNVPVIGWQAFAHTEQQLDLLTALSLLQRHGRMDAALSPDDLRLLRLMCHASEGDRHVWRKACALLHQALAVRLRRHEPLPMDLLVLLTALVMEMNLVAAS